MKAWLLRLFRPRAAKPAAPLHRSGPTPSGPAVRGPASAPVARPAAGRPGAAASTAAAVAADPLAAVRELVGSGVPSGNEAAFFAWLLGVEPSAAPSAERERHALHKLDKLIAAATAGSSLLPRSAAVVPRLLAQLRGASVSLPDLAGQISRDMTLVAEVLRMANSSLYRPPEAVVEVAQAIRVLGVDGLRRAIARAVLKPLIDAPAGKQAAHATQRLWEHTDRKAQLCSALARCVGLDAFEGYLLGLVHNAVWSVVLRSVEGLEEHGPWRIDEPFAAALAARRDRLFGLIARQWQLSESLTRVAADVARRDPGVRASPPVLLLHAGHRLAWLLCGQGVAPAPALIDAAGPHLRGCYESLSLHRAETA